MSWRDAELKSMDKYIGKIVETFNEHAQKADELSVNGGLFDQSYHAFMANAISMAVCRSSNADLKRRFAQETV